MIKMKKISILLFIMFGSINGANVYAQKANEIIVNTLSPKEKSKKDVLLPEYGTDISVNKEIDRVKRKEIIKENLISKDEPLEISLVHINNAKTITGKTAIRFKVMLEGKSNSELKIKIEDRFNNDNSNLIIPSLISAEEDIAIIPLNELRKKTELKELDLFLIPELILNTDDFYKISTSQVAKKLLRKINEKNNDFIALGFISSGKKIIAGKDKLFDLDKIKNKTIAINDNGLAIDYYSILEPKEIIDKNTDKEKYYDFKNIDYIETTLEKYSEDDLSKDFKNINEFYNTYDTQVLVINKSFYNSLPQKYKNDIGFILKNVLEYNLEELDRVERLNKNYFKNQNINILEDAYHKSNSFENNAKIIHNNYLKNINSELLLESYEILNN